MKIGWRFMKREAKLYLFDIQRAAGYVGEFTDGAAFEDYDGDAFMRSATERQLGILGQATVQLAQHFPEVAERISDYRQIIAFRNILIHEYGRVDNRIVWERIQNFLPRLVDEAQALLDDRSAGGERSESGE